MACRGGHSKVLEFMYEKDPQLLFAKGFVSCACFQLFLFLALTQDLYISSMIGQVYIIQLPTTAYLPLNGFWKGDRTLIRQTRFVETVCCCVCLFGLLLLYFYSCREVSVLQFYL